MGVIWNPVGVPGAVGWALGLVMAAYVYLASPRQKANRRLAILFYVEAWVIGSGAGLMYFMDSAADAYALQAIFVTSIIASPFAYLLFIATLDTPLTRPLRSPYALGLLLVLWVAAEAYWFTHPSLFIPGMVRVWYAPWEAIIGDTFLLFWNLAGIVAMFAVIAAIHAYRRAAPGTPARARAKMYVAAFASRDILLVLLTFVFPMIIAVPPSNTWTDMIYIWGYPAALLLFAGLVFYGMMKFELFDLDLRIKHTVSRGALLGVFLVVFFTVEQLAQNYVSDEYGWLFGVGAALPLFFAFRPLERAAGRLADAAMPRVRDTEDYRRQRKVQVYRAAIETVLDDGVVSSAERALLDGLREELGIGEDEAKELERDARQAIGSA